MHSIYVLIISVTVLSTISVASKANNEINCPKNEHYEACGTACPVTCDNYRIRIKVCGNSCQEGCFCDSGFIRDLNANKCVHPANCTLNCDPDFERLKECGISTCERTCEREVKCFVDCDKLCLCKNRYYRNNYGLCVDAKYC